MKTRKPGKLEEYRAQLRAQFQKPWAESRVPPEKPKPEPKKTEQ